LLALINKFKTFLSRIMPWIYPRRGYKHYAGYSLHFLKSYLPAFIPTSFFTHHLVLE